MESVSVLHALVYKHLLKVTPNLTGEFKKFQTISSSFNYPTLEEMVLKLLANSAVHSQLLVIAPNIAKEFRGNHPIIPNCDISLRKLLNHYFRKETLTNLLENCVVYNQLHVVAPQLAKDFRVKRPNIQNCDISIKKLLDQFYGHSTPIKEKENHIAIHPCEAKCVVSMPRDRSVQNDASDPSYKSSYNQNFIHKLIHNSTDICAGNDAHELCNLSESSTYQALRNHLKENSVVDKIVLHILNENIKISKMNLEHVVLASGQVQRKYHHVPSNIEIGRFSTKDSSIIGSNWNKLVTDLLISNPQDVFQMFCKRAKKLAKLKANVLALYLSQGMEKLRLAADVFFHAERKLVNFVSGKFSQTEHEFIMKYVSKNGDYPKTFNEIAKTLNRLYPDVIRRHFLRQNKDMFKKGTYTLEEKKFFIREIMKRSNIKSVLEIKNVYSKEGTVKKETFEDIAKQLGRPVHNIVNHWEQILKPILLQFHAGTLTFDPRRLLANHLLDKNIVYMQDVPWVELLQNPQFAGYTKLSLNRILDKLITATQRAKKCKREEVTIQQVADLANKKYSDHSVKTGGKSMAQKLAFVAYYESLIHSSENG